MGADCCFSLGDPRGQTKPLGRSTCLAVSPESAPFSMTVLFIPVVFWAKALLQVSPTQFAVSAKISGGRTRINSSPHASQRAKFSVRPSPLGLSTTTLGSSRTA